MPSPTIYSYTLEDQEGIKASVAIYVAFDAATETVGALVGNFAALGGLIDAISDARIIDGRITVDVAPDPSWKTAAVNNNPVEKTGLFNFDQAGSKYAQAFDIPAIADAVIASGRINLANAAVVAFINALILAAGIGGSHTVFANSKYSNALTALRDAAITFRKHRRQLNRASFEI